MTTGREVVTETGEEKRQTKETEEGGDAEAVKKTQGTGSNTAKRKKGRGSAERKAQGKQPWQKNFSDPTEN